MGDRHEPVTVGPGQDGECLPVTALGLLDEIAIQLARPPAAPIGDAFRLY